MRSLPAGSHAVVVGASGGIGAALVWALLADPAIGMVTALSRQPSAGDGKCLRTGVLDLEDEGSIRDAAAALPAPPRLVIVATGLLHDAAMRPEKSYDAIDPVAMQRSFAVNAIGPALLAKHMLPPMARAVAAEGGRAVFAALGARIGSIGDNRSGGWHSYRASKAALAMIIRNLAIETARRTPDLFCVGLHPGTVATGLSLPFRRGVPDGTLFEPGRAAGQLLSVLDRLEPEHDGSVLAWDGSIVPP